MVYISIFLQSVFAVDHFNHEHPSETQNEPQIVSSQHNHPISSNSNHNPPTETQNEPQNVCSPLTEIHNGKPFIIRTEFTG